MKNLKTMKSLYKYLAAFGLLSANFTAQSQDVHFSQISQTPLLRNPALSGIFTGDIRVQTLYRTQWGSVTVPYQTGSLNGEYRLPVGQASDFLTIGGQILYDKAGTIGLTTSHLLPCLNYHKSLSETKTSYLSLGFMGGMVRRSFDRSKVTTNNQFNGIAYDPGLSDGENFNATSYSYWDVSTGMSYNGQLSHNENDNFYLGLAYHHFNKPRNISFYSDKSIEMSPKWVASAGTRFGMTDYSFFTVESDFTRQGAYSEFMAGALYTWKLDQQEFSRYALHLGAYLRWKDALIPTARIDIDKMSISVSYDANISALKTASSGRGGFEISLSYQKQSNRENSSRSYIRCPQF